MKKLLSLIVVFALIALMFQCNKKSEPAPTPTPTPTPTALTISSVSPATGAVGTKVVITGTGFSTTITDNVVKFGGIAATLDSATTTRLVTKVPKDALTGKITVEAGGKSATSSADFTITTAVISPSLSTANTVTGITDTGAKVNGTITGNGSSAITQHGHVWSKTNQTPTTTADSKTELGTTDGPFPLTLTSELKGLEANTTYYVRLYATTKEGTVYGEVFQVKTTTAVATSVVIPDANFEQALVDLKIDKDGAVNGRVNSQDVASVQKLIVTDKKIKSLKGIEAFTNLEYLDCSRNQINGVDLDVSQNKKLTWLGCSSNQLFGTYIFSENVETLYCNDNKLTVLIFNGNSQLKFLQCDKNELVVLNIGACSKLGSLYCMNNKLESIMLGNHTILTTFNCEYNQLKSLNVSAMVRLQHLNCNDNKISSLDVSKNAELKSLYCGANQLTALDVSKNTNLEKFAPSVNQLTSLDVSKNTKLSFFGCGSNKLTTLDVSKNTELDFLTIENNKLNDLNISNNLKLTILYFSENKLSSIDISKNTKLRQIIASDNQLNGIDVSKNADLIILRCQTNKLTNLDVSKNGALKYLSCQSNATLKTICVADVAKAKANTDWQKDAGAEYKKCD